MEEQDLKKIEEIVGEFLQKMTIAGFDVKAGSASETKYVNFDSLKAIDGLDSISESGLDARKTLEAINVDINLGEPQFLIGQNGQTLFEFQRLLRIVLNKKLGKSFYLNLDINEYKKKKNEYIKDMAKTMASEVALTKEKKILPPMSSYERRLIHAELAGRPDVVTESQGEGSDRHLVIKPK